MQPVPQAMKSSRAVMKKNRVSFLGTYLIFIARWTALSACGVCLLYVLPLSLQPVPYIMTTGFRSAAMPG